MQKQGQATLFHARGQRRQGESRQQLWPFARCLNLSGSTAEAVGLTSMVVLHVLSGAHDLFPVGAALVGVGAKCTK